MNGLSKLWNQQMWKVIYVSEEQMFQNALNVGPTVGLSIVALA